MSVAIQLNRQYKGDVSSHYLTYNRTQKHKLKDGTIKVYTYKVKRKRNLKRLGINPPKRKRSIKGDPVGRPKRLTGALHQLVLKMSDAEQRALLKHIEENSSIVGTNI